MWNAIKTGIVKFLLTKDACVWIVKTALNAALSRAKEYPAKREQTCDTLSAGSDLLKTTSEACRDGVVTDAESQEIETKGVAFGSAIFTLIKG